MLSLKKFSISNNSPIFLKVCFKIKALLIKCKKIIIIIHKIGSPMHSHSLLKITKYGFLKIGVILIKNFGHLESIFFSIYDVYRNSFYAYMIMNSIFKMIGINM